MALLEYADLLRLEANRRISHDRRGPLGQFLTPMATARYMASLFETRHPSACLLDAGAGVGSLAAAFVAEACSWEPRPSAVAVIAVEIDALLAGYCARVLEACRAVCERAGIEFRSRVMQEGFLPAAAGHEPTFLPPGCEQETTNYVLLNPPYGKFPRGSRYRPLLRAAGIEVNNLYAAFVWLAARALSPAGELVAITPRSFCGGPSFRRFREALLQAMSLRQIHLYTSRDSVFGEDQVLQETVIVRAVKDAAPPAHVHITSSSGEEIAEDLQGILVPYGAVVRPRRGHIRPGDPHHP